MKRLASIGLGAMLLMCPALLAQAPDPQKKTLPPKSPTYPTPAPQEKSEPGVEQLLRDYQAAFNRNDAKALAALYTDKAIRLGPNNEVLYGRAAIEKFYVGSFGGTPGALSIRPGPTQMITADVAVLEGRYEVAGATGIHGAYFLTIVRQNGQWKLASVVPVPDKQ